MTSTMFGKLLVSVALLTASSSILAGDPNSISTNDDAIYLRGGRDMSSYETPLWYARVENDDTTGLLRKCMRRQDPPTTGDHCGHDEKICFFETQDCDGVGAHPMQRCYCDGLHGSQQWQCEEEQCPIYPDPAKTGCAPEGEEIDHGNDSSCPSESPLGAGESYCSEEQDTLQCHYGVESW